MPLAKIRTALSDQLAERRERRQLRTELAAFQSPAERAELDEVLSRYPTEETRHIRAILDSQDMQRHLAAAVIGGHHNRAA